LSGRLTIALDAMGGDHAPAVVLKGANIARQRHPEASFLLVGREAEIRPQLDKLKKLAEVATIIHADDVVAAEDKPSIALRQGRKSSMRLAINAVAEGKAAGVVSAGNTGALMGMAKFVLKTLPGVDRPAIASFFPTMKGETVMLDLGANVECDARNLIDFAIMGRAFARTVLGVPEPTYGLLNVGSEDLKGHDALREARETLASGLVPGFHGFVEGDDITKGTVDVVVTDGFTGNIALKAAEGTAKLMAEYLRRTFRSSMMAGLGYVLARGALKKLRKRMDPRRYNGAVFLGLNAIAVKSHGGTDALGFAHACSVAIDMVKHRLIEKIRADYARLAPATPSKAAIG
jgi:glycerol-3-phosphate acyltransferase PlsX